MIRYLSAMSMLLSGLVDSNPKSLVQRCAFVLTVCLSVWTALGEELLRVGSAVVPPDQLEALLSTPIRTGAAMRRQSGNALFSLAANEKDKKLIVVNPLTRVNAVFDCPAQSARIKVKITPLLMAELRNAGLGDADTYTCILADKKGDEYVPVEKSEEPVPRECSLPSFRYGARGNLRLAKSVERRLKSVSVEAPMPIFAADVPEDERKRILNEIIMSASESGSYRYEYVLPNGDLTTFCGTGDADGCSPIVDKATTSVGNFRIVDWSGFAGDEIGNVDPATSTQIAPINAGAQTWDSVLAITQPVYVLVGFASLENGTIGCSYMPETYTKDGVQYPAALIDQIMGADMHPSSCDISILYSKRFAFYYGTDGNCPLTQLDLRSTVSHELCHGLGFSSYHYRGWNGSSPDGTWINADRTGMNEEGAPSVFDTFLYSGSGRLTAMTQSNRASAFTSGNLYWDGENAKSANGGSRVKMYAPPVYNPGSSVSHWDNSVSFKTFMKYATTNGEVCHDVDSRLVGAFKDMGWSIRSDPATPSAPGNDNFGNATVISGQSGSTTGSNVGATSETGEPLLNEYASATTTVWWKWTAPTDGRVTIDTIGSSFDTQMCVYRAPSMALSFALFSLVAKDDDGGVSNTSVCTFDCTGGTTYYICIGGYQAKTGSVALNWNMAASEFVIENGVLTKYQGAGGNVTIPSTVTAIGAHAFSGNEKLTGVVIPSSVTTIADAAFSGCRGLRTIDIPSSVKAIGYSAFNGAAVTEIELKEGLESIGDYAFVACYNLSKVTIPASVTSIGRNPFYSCTALTAIDVCSDNAAYCSVDGVLYDKDKSILVSFPSGKDAPAVILPSVQTIAAYSFCDCVKLTTVTIPASVTAIGGFAFENNPQLKSAYFEGNAPTDVGYYIFNSSSDLVTYVRDDSTGWKTAGSSELPDKWQSHPIAYCPSTFEFDANGGSKASATFPNSSGKRWYLNTATRPSWVTSLCLVTTPGMSVVSLGTSASSSIAWTGDAYFSFTAAANGTGSDRSWTVTARNSDGNEIKSFHLHQPANSKANLAFVTPDGWPAAVYFTDGVDSRESKLTFKEGDAAYLNVGFVNNGNADAPAYKIKHQFLDADGSDVFQPIVTLCSDGQTVGKVACYANWDWGAITQYDPGVYTYKCTLDCDDEVDEDKSDNVFACEITIIENVPDKPEAVWATKGASDAYVEISWETAEGAWSYDLYRSVTDSLPSDASPIKRNLTGNSVRDTDAVPGVKYYYWVEAIGAYGVTLSESSYGYRKVALSVEDETLTVGADGGEGSVTIAANTSWSASADVSWITVTTASGSGNGSVAYTVAASASTEPRTGTITIVAGKDYPETLAIEIVQEGRISEMVPPFTINGVERSAGFGAGWSYANSRLTISESGNYLLSGSCTNGEVRVYVDGVDACLTLSNLTLIAESGSGGVIQLRSGSNVSMFLCETNTLKSGYGRGGIEVPNGAKLSISHSRSVARDFLFVTGGEDATGIGGNTQGSHGCGDIRIMGGTVVATGGYRGAGIGAGEGDPFDGNIEIVGGIVYAYGGSGADGIGRGNHWFWEMPKKDSAIKIRGGSLYCCEGEDMDLSDPTRGYDLYAGVIAVSGGSVVCGSGSFPKTVVDDQGETVYVVQVELPESFVPNGAVKVEGLPDYYGTNDLFAVDGRLAFWLPCGRYELTFSAYDDSGCMRQFAETVVAGTPPEPRIETGKWNYDYALAKAFADEKGLPLVVFWTNPGCAQCEKLIAAFKTQKFQDWQTSREYVFVYSEGDATVRELVKNASGAFPYVAVLWPSQGVDVRFTGRVGMMPVKEGDVIDQFTQSVDNSIAVVATPVITPEEGTTFDVESCTVTITCARAGATIYYSTNGSTPRQKDQFKYTQPFTITGTTTIKAVAVKDGFTQSEIVTVTITKVDPLPLTFASALDEPKLSAVETDGDAEWVPVKDVTAVGGSSARSGVIGIEQRTCLKATVYGKGSLSFSWKVSCEEDGDKGAYTYDHLTFSTVEGGRTNDIAKIDGETEWLSESVTFTTDGPHVILWTYSTDDWEEPGFEDCGWVDHVVWTGDAPPSDIVIPDAVALPKAEVESYMAKYPSLAAQVGGDAEAFAKLPSATGKLDENGNQMYVWQDIIAGTDPTNPDDKFKIVDIKFEDGELKITWSPDLNEGGKKNVRAYTEFGRKELGTSEEWTNMKDVNPAEKNDYKFRKVTVDMP